MKFSVDWKRCALGPILAVFGVTALAMPLSATTALAETKQVRMAEQFGLTYLPLIVMRHHGLLKKHAKDAGLGDIEVSWKKYGGGSVVIDSLLAGDLDFGALGTPPAITVWDKTRRSVDVRGVAAFSAVPQFLVTSNPNIKSLKDFKDGDKIAVPAVKVSLQATLLQMAAAKTFGKENFAKLDKLTVSMKHPDAAAALMSGESLTAAFSNVPFQYQLLENPKIHKVLDSFKDILGGPVTNGVIIATQKFRTDNPKTYKAFLGALDEAMDRINNDRRAAAEAYVKESKSSMSVDEVTKMISDPTIQFTTAPLNVMTFATFMHERGRIDTKPNSWKDMFFPEIHDKNGS